MIQNFSMPSENKMSFVEFCESRSINNEWREGFNHYAFTTTARENYRTEKVWNNYWVNFLRTIDQEKIPW